MSGPSCDLCARPLPDPAAYVCPSCVQKTAEALELIASLACEVETAIAKLVRFNRGPGGGSGERPLPVDLKAGERAAAVGNTVATWARHVSESRGEPVAPVVEAQAYGPLCHTGTSVSQTRATCPHWSCDRIRVRRRETGVEAAARFLASPGNLRWLQHRREGAESFTGLVAAARDLQRLVDRPTDLWYAGPCRNDLPDDTLCEADIYAVPGKAVVRCKQCGAEYDAAKRKDWLLQEAHDALVHAELMARALYALGIDDVTPARVRGMARHGRLVAHGEDRAGRPLYKVGEVLAVIEEQDRIEAERAASRAAKAARAEARKAAAADEAA